MNSTACKRKPKKPLQLAEEEICPTSVLELINELMERLWKWKIKTRNTAQTNTQHKTQYKTQY